MKKRIRNAVSRYLEAKGFEILEKNWKHGDNSVDLIADDDGEIVFVFITSEGDSENGFAHARITRKLFESLAIAYLATHSDTCNCSVRADEVSLVVVSPDKAMLRHWINMSGDRWSD